MRRRYKLLIIIFISFIMTLFIYFFIKRDQYIFVSIGETKSINNLPPYKLDDYLKNILKEKVITKEYNADNDPYDSLLEFINHNHDNICYFLKNASAITIIVAGDEIHKYININDAIIDDYIKKITNLIEKIKKLNNNLYLINITEMSVPNIYERILYICSNLEINCIDLDDIGRNNIFYLNEKIYLNNYGIKNIVQYIISKSPKLSVDI